MKATDKKISKALEDNFGKDILNKTLSLPQISKRLKSFVGCFQGKAKVHREKKIKIGKRFVVSGQYDERKAVGERLELVLHVPKKTEKIRFNSHTMKKLHFVLVQALYHELIHKKQASSGKKCSDRSVPCKLLKKDIKKKEKNRIMYLSEIREINAYGHDIAMEIIRYYPEISFERVMKNIHMYRKLISYQFYLKTFKHTNWDKVKKLLHEEIRNWRNHSLEIIPC